MIEFNYENDFHLVNENIIKDWITGIIKLYNCELGEVNYIFCSDEYLHKLNVQFLQHDTLTDIISFDNSMGKIIAGDVFISIDRVKDNALDYNVCFDEELRRVMIHGILHYIGFKDKTSSDKNNMVMQEDKALELFRSDFS